MAHHSRFIASPSVTAAILSVVALSVVNTAAPPVPQTSCRTDCQISLVSVARFVAAGDQKKLMPLESMLVQPLGREGFVAVARSKAGVLVSDKYGRVSKTVSTVENRSFGHITDILASSEGSVEIYDIQNRTLTNLGTGSRSVSVRSARYQPTLILDEKRYIHAGNIRTPELVGQPMHLVGMDGSILTSFGAHASAFREDEPFVNDRVIGRGQGNTIWAAAVGRYVLEHWDPALPRELRRVDVPSSWFKGPVGNQGPSSRPTSLVQGIWEVDGYLWVLLSDADLNWAPPAAQHPDDLRDPQKERMGSLDPQAVNRRADWILEVIDPKQRRVIASRRFDRAVWARGSSFLFASRGVRGAWDEAAIELWRPALTAKRRKP